MNPTTDTPPKSSTSLLFDRLSFIWPLVATFILMLAILLLAEPFGQPNLWYRESDPEYGL